MASEALIEVNDDNYKEIVKSGLVLIDFWAPWCGPCQAMTPIIEAVAEKYNGKVTVGKCNVDESPQTSAALSIQSIPTLKFYSDGDIVEQFVGVTQEAVLTEILDFELE